MLNSDIFNLKTLLKLQKYRTKLYICNSFDLSYYNASQNFRIFKIIQSRKN